MWEKLRSIWTIPDLRKKILFTLMILLIPVRMNQQSKQQNA